MSRYQMYNYGLIGLGNGIYALKVQICAVYGPLIQECFPQIAFGFAPPPKGACNIQVALATNQETALRALLELLKNHVILLKNKSLQRLFRDELDHCFALDYNYGSDENSGTRTYTPFGWFEHSAKESRDESAAQALAAAMASFVKNHPLYDAADAIVPVPPNPSKAYHFPCDLAARLATLTGKDWYNSLVTKRQDTAKMQSLPVAQKVPALESVLTIHPSVAGKRIILVDDLYQSGSTIWTVAKALKAAGCARVLGLVCVKSWRDTDNT